MFCPNLMSDQIPPPPQPDNPSDIDRMRMLQYALYKACRPEDFPYIVKALSVPMDITRIAVPGQFKGLKVGIIGGGLAGMSAAFELRKLGFDITIFEANNERIGGRVYTYYFNKEKTLYGELGAMRIPVGHEAVWYYINLFKLNTRPFVQVNKNAFIYLHDIRVRNDPMGINVMQQIYPTYDMAPWEMKIPWQQLGYYGLEGPFMKGDIASRIEILEVRPYYQPKTLLWDAFSTRQAMESTGLSQGAINLLSDLYPIGGEFLYNSYIDFAQEYYPSNFAFLYEIVGGMANLPLEFYNSFVRDDVTKYYPHVALHQLGNVSWSSGKLVKGIGRRGPEKVSLFYSPVDSNDIFTEDFDYVVCAAPLSTVRTMDITPLFSSKKMQAIKEVNYDPALKSALNCGYRFWEHQGIYGGGSYTDLPVTMLWYPSDHAKYGLQTQMSPYSSALSNRVTSGFAPYQYPGILLTYCFNLDAVRLGNMTPQQRLDQVKREVEQVHGLPNGFMDNVVLDYKAQLWNHDPYERGAFSYFTPQQKKLFSYGLTLPEYDERVFFAGEHVSALHRWMHGALQTGMIAANGIARAATKQRL